MTTWQIAHRSLRGNKSGAKIAASAIVTLGFTGEFVSEYKGHMPDSLDVAKADGYLRITFSGLFSPESARYFVRAMLAACVKENCDKILFDCTPMAGNMSAVDRFEVAEYSASILPRTLKIAVLGRQDQILPDNFFENVARNLGLTLTVFSEIDDAIKWLKG